MKYYTIKEEYLTLWTNDATVTPTTIIDSNEVSRLALSWGKDEDELIAEQLEEVTSITVWKCKELYASFAAPRDVYFRTKEEAKAYMENNTEAFDLRKVTYKSEKKINEVLAELNKTEGST